MEQIIKIIKNLKSEKDFIIIAIDGACASGKTTLATHLHDIFDCNIIHMDDFFLQPKQRTKKRMEEIGGNIDYERFYEEVILNLKPNHDFSYHKFDCRIMDFSETIEIKSKNINIIEGSYSLHPYFKDYADLKIFLDISSQKQLQRILVRNGIEQLEIFKNKWIVLENDYFQHYKIKDKCDLIKVF